MSNKYIFFRTDRIGDFLMSAILIKAIKRSDPNAYITVVASKKNHDYIKTFSYVDETILIPENYLKNPIVKIKYGGQLFASGGHPNDQGYAALADYFANKIGLI